MSAPPPFDKLYWFRIGLGAVGGALAKLVFSPSQSASPDYADGILVAMIFYLASYYIARYAMFRKLQREYFVRLYTTGIGSFIMMFIFVWVLLFTLLP